MPLPRHSPRHRARYRPHDLQRRARGRLRRYRQATAFVVALTALALVLLPPRGDAQEPDPARSVEEATGTLSDLVDAATALAPKIIIALGLLLVASLLGRLVHAALDRFLSSWKRAQATSALVSLSLWLLALGSALSVIAGDASALLGSVGLVGLALSWSLQAPIESFTGWLLNSFRGYYEIGDRISVGDVFGDVYDIDLLTTTVWEAGGPDKPVQAAQPTGALVTFPNSEILRANIVNFTRMFPYVWDEITVSVGDDSDVPHLLSVFRRVAHDVVGPTMSDPADAYVAMLARAGLPWEVATEPEVYLAPEQSWTNVTVRYLVPARERRRWSSVLYEALLTELGRPEHRERVRPAVVRATLRNDTPE